jgi:hypothetical protein
MNDALTVGRLGYLVVAASLRPWDTRPGPA